MSNPTRRPLINGRYCDPDVIEEITRLNNAIPFALKVRPNFMVHKNKVPFSPVTHDYGSSRDSLTWAHFWDALDALQDYHYDGLCFTFSTGDPFCGIDLDDCRNPQSGEIEKWALGILKRFRGYAELSQSGKGIHLILKRKTTAAGNKFKLGEGKKAIEVYSQARYFCMTGRALDVSSL